MTTRTILRPDPWLLPPLLILALVGLATLYSAVHQGDHAIWWRQLLFWVVGLTAMGCAAMVPLRMIALAVWPAFLLSMLLLALVPWIGDLHMGARRWLVLGPLRLQPSELVKWTLAMMLAWWFAGRPADEPHTLWLPTLAIAAAVALVIGQPDLGTALVILMEGMAMLLLSGFRWRWLLGLIAASPFCLWLLWNNMHDYQRQRVRTFLDPQSDPLGAGYHVIQSTIAIGSGGIAGKGFLHGTQDRLHFLPEQHTDFIFAVLAEEGGLIASLLLLSLYAWIIVRILIIAARAHTRFGALLCGGVAAIFFIYVFVNIGMVCGLLPVVGVPLPFVSYGGSALITMLTALGVVMRVAAESRGRIPWQRPGNPLA
ncbi:MAG: rod shape-determining protein RodA [Zetaproteobacteria bacterium]|nr:MAG: rod shape-determining protein RodA [Zetaproteobacteria bacterium]